MADDPSLWSQVIAPENLWHAYQRARKGKRRRPDVAAFSLRVEEELYNLHQALLNGRYQSGGYRQFTIHDRKPRLISAAPFRDRVVHHALMAVIEPRLEALLIPNCWACRRGKGTHRAVRQYQRWARRYAYALKMDISRYFPSIDQQRLMTKLSKVIDDDQVLNLFGIILDSACSVEGKGLPIGNLTSQILSNFYLNDLDHYITDTLGMSAYLRYVDDLIVCADTKDQLWQTYYEVFWQLRREGLQLHPRKVYLTPTRCGLDVLGYRVYPHMIRLRRDNGYRFRRRLKTRLRAYQSGRLDWPQFNNGVQSWLGHARQADSHGLRRALFSEIVIRRGAPEQAAAAWWFVEQQPAQPAFG